MTTATYITGEWHGLPNYECSDCPFASLEEGTVLAHMAQRHPIAPVFEPDEAPEPAATVAEVAPQSTPPPTPVEAPLPLSQPDAEASQLPADTTKSKE